MKRSWSWCWVATALAGSVLATVAGGATASAAATVPPGVINTFAGGGSPADGIGDGGPANQATLDGPYGVATAGSVVYVSEERGNRVRKIDANGVISTYAGGGSPASGIGDGGPATAASLSGPRGLATDPAGNLYISDCGNHRVREVIAASGRIKTVAGGGTPADGVGDGRAATKAGLGCPTGLFFLGFDPGFHNYPVGTLLIADCDAGRVRNVDPAGKISTLAGGGSRPVFTGGEPLNAKLNCPTDALILPSGLTEASLRDDNAIITISGFVNPIIGNGLTGFAEDNVNGAFTPANGPGGLAFHPGDDTGHVVFTESTHARVRDVLLNGPGGITTTAAGIAIPGFGGDGFLAPTGVLDGPRQLAYDAGGNLYITDYNNGRVRIVGAGVPSPPTSGCGQVITKNTTLKADIGPCAGDGIVLGADRVTLDLGGHTIRGSGPGDGTRMGVRLFDRHGSTVRNGTISGFDAGVGIIGGNANLVSGLTIADNLGSPIPTPGGSTSVFGDGIAIFFASSNRVENSQLLRNGPYDGVAMLGIGSNNNTIKNNVIRDSPANPDDHIGGIGIITNAFLGFGLPGRGSVLVGNDILGNTISGNARVGISNISNTGAVVANNTVENNGLDDPNGFGPGNGIGIQPGGGASPLTGDSVSNNQVHGNGNDGIFVLGEGNKIVRNNAANNLASDLYDATGCTNNVWLRNIWGSGGFFPDCVTKGGSGPAPVAAQKAAASQPVPSLDAVANRGGAAR